MIEQEKQEKIQYHLMELRKLRATPRSDWHAGFEAALRIELHKYGNAVQLSTEEELGTMPPRVDYMILVENRKVAFERDTTWNCSGWCWGRIRSLLQWSERSFLWKWMRF